MFDPAVSYLNPEPVMKWEMILDNSNVCKAEINLHLTRTYYSMSISS